MASRGTLMRRALAVRMRAPKRQPIRTQDAARIARRVLGGSHPEVVIIERSLRCARAKQLRARKTPDDSVAIPAQERDIAQVTATKKRQGCDTSDRERSRPRVSAENDADDIE